MAKKKRALTTAEGSPLHEIAFNPMDAPLDLTKNEKLRTTALMLAIQYVTETICKDAEMYRALKQDGQHLATANVPHVVTCAINFEAFLLGRVTVAKQAAAEQPPSVDAVDPHAASTGKLSTREKSSS